jgi:MFS family permease
MLAALLAALVLPRHGWRTLFLFGVLPALLTVWIRRRVPESELWQAAHARRQASRRLSFWALLRPPLRQRTLVAALLATCLLLAYWGLFTWLPNFLAAPVSAGGAGLGLVRSLGFILPMQVGAFFGYVLFGVFADRWGRRPVFIAFTVAAAGLVPVFALGGQLRAGGAQSAWLLAPLLGFFGHGYFSVFGALLAELFPSEIRATAQGLCYNVGRAVSALAPLLIGVLAERRGLGSALCLTSAFYLAGAALMLGLPETKGEVLL